MADPRLINDDLAPTTPEQRTWSKWHIAALWVGMAVCIPTYMLAADLMDSGASLGTAVLAIAVGNLVVLVPLVLNAHPGTQYGIPFPVLLRSSFGVLGANVPALMRAVVACGWFGINTWFGGLAIYALTAVLIGGWPSGMEKPIAFLLDINAAQLLSFTVFWAIQVAIIVRGMNSIKVLEGWAAPILLLIGVVLFGWAWNKVGSLDAMLQSHEPSKGTGDALAAGITGAVAFWGTLALNIPDFARYARTQRDQIVGQAISLPLTMTLYAFVGAAVTNATVLIFGAAIKNPVDLMAKIGGAGVALISMFALGLATLSTNLAANIVSPANDISNLAPHKISFKKGAVIAACAGVLFLPWKLADSVMLWLGAYGAVLGAVGGIMIADYYLIRRKELHVEDLYQRGGQYEYRAGFNPIAFIALASAIALNLPGMLDAVGVASAGEFFVSLYKWAWFVAFFVAGSIHAVGTLWSQRHHAARPSPR